MSEEQGRPVVAVVLARMNSGRLPGKMMLELEGKPLLGHVLDRLSLSRTLDKVVVATSSRPENNALAAYCARRCMPCFRGSEEDVLGRLLGTLEWAGAVTGVSVCGDQPLVDPDVLDDLVNHYLSHQEQYDFVSNDQVTTYPSGVEVGVFSTDVLRDGEKRASSPEMREHATLCILKNKDRYRCCNRMAPEGLQRPDLAIEVDEAVDVEVVRAILHHFRDRPDFRLPDIIRFLDQNPGIKNLNANVHRRWKQFRQDSAPDFTKIPHPVG